jgi:hypothetical protein
VPRNKNQLIVMGYINLSVRPLKIQAVIKGVKAGRVFLTIAEIRKIGLVHAD